MPKYLYGGSSEPQLINLKDSIYNINVLYEISDYNINSVHGIYNSIC